MAIGRLEERKPSCAGRVSSAGERGREDQLVDGSLRLLEAALRGAPCETAVDSPGPASQAADTARIWRIQGGGYTSRRRCKVSEPWRSSARGETVAGRVGDAVSGLGSRTGPRRASLRPSSTRSRR